MDLNFKTMALVKANVQQRNAAELDEYCQYVESGMAGNPHFLNPVPPLADITAARVDLQAKIQLASSGAHAAVAARNLAAKLLRGLLTALARYVNSASNGDENVARSSNLDPVAKRSPVGPLDPPVNMECRIASKEGNLHARWDPRYGARSYQVYICEGDPNVEANWSLVGVTTRSYHTLDNLESGKFYWVRVNALGAAGVSGMSDPARGLAA